MKFKWIEYLNLSRDLYNRGQNKNDEQEQEAYYRCGISRSYYAAFKLADDYLKTRPWYNAGAFSDGSHDYVIEQYKKQTDETMKNIGNNLSNLKLQRIRADYKDEYYAHGNKSLQGELLKAIQRSKDISRILGENP
jgi:hypothetical protein